MKLYLASAIGRGSTELGAFDAALFGAGVANLNLVRLSSVIPPGSDIIQVERCPFEQNGRWGDRLYAVYAEQRTTTPGEQVWAGVGWCQDRETGQGLFVEHHGDRRTARPRPRSLRASPTSKRFEGSISDPSTSASSAPCASARRPARSSSAATQPSPGTPRQRRTATLASRRDHDPSLAWPLHVPGVSSGLRPHAFGPHAGRATRRVLHRRYHRADGFTKAGNAHVRHSVTEAA